LVCPALSLSLHKTAHTNPVHERCPAGEVNPRTKSTSSNTPRLPLEESKETNAYPIVSKPAKPAAVVTPKTIPAASER
jgi:hypothetical protein